MSEKSQQELLDYEMWRADRALELLKRWAQWRSKAWRWPPWMPSELRREMKEFLEEHGPKDE
jgi:hypothetical protein